MELIVRCKKCGKVMKGKSKKSKISGRCPRCRDSFVISDPVSQESRKYKRLVVGESKLVKPLPETLTRRKASPTFRVMFTEVPPNDFAMNRSDYIPLLDLSEGGMGLLSRVNDISSKLQPGDSLVVEIDFPILTQTIFVEVEVCWIRPIKDDKLLQIVVRFCESDDSFPAVLKNLLKYIESRTETMDFDKWGSFG